MSLAVRARWPRGDFRLDVDLQLALTGVTALFGRSGCGKTSLLRLLAGLDRVPAADVRCGDDVWQQGRYFVPLHQRRIGLVFQEHSLLPHLSVRGNLEYGYRRTPAAQRRLHPADITDLLGLETLLDRDTQHLSGGERQRVAIGRALLTSPRLLLLDEPLSALDTQTRREVMPFLARLATEVGVPMVLVTHAADEVERLADQVVFLHDGRVTSQLPLQAALSRPDSPLFADDGTTCILNGQLLPPDGCGLARFGNDQLQLLIQADPRPVRRLRIHCRDVAIAVHPVEQVSIQNQLPLTIIRITDVSPGRVLVTGQLADGQWLSAEITATACQQLQLASGQRVFALIKSVALLD